MAPSDTCGIYDAGFDTRIIVTAPNAIDECRRLATSLSSGGDYWTLRYRSASSDLSEVCIVRSGVDSVEVEDSSPAIFGQSVCSGFIQSGWSEDTAAEQQHASALASASAAASQQAQDQQDEQVAANALEALNQDADFGSELASLASDVKQTASDLAMTRSDAQAGGGDQCLNASTTVYNDAATTVFNDAQTTLLNDADAVARSIQTVGQDITNLAGAEAQLNTDGLSAPAGADSAVSAAQRAAENARSTANSDIDTVNGYVSAAYAVANSIATGPCAGDGPGDPPSPVGHI